MLARTCGAASAGPVLQRVQSQGLVRVCIWPDYYGVTYHHPRTQALVGIDIELSAELGRDLKAKVQYVESSFPTLINDLNNDRCDVAMFAVGILPGRRGSGRVDQGIEGRALRRDPQAGRCGPPLPAGARPA